MIALRPYTSKLAELLRIGFAEFVLIFDFFKQGGARCDLYSRSLLSCSRFKTRRRRVILVLDSRWFVFEFRQNIRGGAPV